MPLFEHLGPARPITPPETPYKQLLIAAEDLHEPYANKTCKALLLAHTFTPSQLGQALRVALVDGFNIKLALTFVKAGADITSCSPLHEACCAFSNDTKAERADRLALMKALLARGAPLDAIGTFGRTPLHTAVSSRFLEGVAFLLEKHGANPNIASKGGILPIHQAASQGLPEITNLLIQHGANTQIKCAHYNNQTPADIAASRLARKQYYYYETGQVSKYRAVEKLCRASDKKLAPPPKKAKKPALSSKAAFTPAAAALRANTAPAFNTRSTVAAPAFNTRAAKRRRIAPS